MDTENAGKFVPKAPPRGTPPRPSRKTPFCLSRPVEDEAHDWVRADRSIIPPNTQYQCTKCRRYRFEPQTGDKASMEARKALGPRLAGPGEFLDREAHPDVAATLDALRGALKPVPRLGAYRVQAIEKRVMASLGDEGQRIEALRDYWDMWVREQGIEEVGRG